MFDLSNLRENADQFLRSGMELAQDNWQIVSAVGTALTVVGALWTMIKATKTTYKVVKAIGFRMKRAAVAVKHFFSPREHASVELLRVAFNDPEGVWDSNTNEMLCEGLIIKVDRSRLYVVSIFTDEGQGPDVMPDLSEREKAVVNRMAKEAIDRIEKRDLDERRQEHVKNIISSGRHKSLTTMGALRKMNQHLNGSKGCMSVPAMSQHPENDSHKTSHSL